MKEILMILLIGGLILFGAISFGVSLKKRIIKKEYIDSLRIEKLKLDLSIKPKSQVMIKVDTCYENGIIITQDIRYP